MSETTQVQSVTDQPTASPQTSAPPAPSCSCRKEIEAKLTERFQQAAPDAREHSVKLQGYGFALVGNRMTMRPFLNYKSQAIHPLKRGGEKSKTSIGNMMFSFCPFCGVKIGEGGAA